MRGFEEQRWIWQRQWSLPSSLGTGAKLIEEITAQLQQNQWPDRDVFAIQLAVEEAIVNAIKHGNRFDQNKMVFIHCWLSRELFRIEIADEGEGFDPDALPDPTSPERLEEPTGRGVMLMRTFMNRVTYNAKGNVVTLEKQRSSD
jgi:serine/threonine-protein kinase RsbW